MLSLFSGSQGLPSPSSSIDEVLKQEDLREAIVQANNGIGSSTLIPKVIAWAEKNLAKLLSTALREISADVAAQNVTLATTYPANATELLCLYCTRAASPGTAISEVVPIVVATLSRKGLLHSVICQNISRIALAAFAEDAQQTTASVSMILNEEVLHGAIRQLSTNAVVGEMILRLIGGDVSPGLLLTIPPTLFVDSWIKLRFPMHLARYVKIAMSYDSNVPYFQFLNDVMSKAVDQTVGPLVDEFFTAEVFGVFVSDVVDAIADTKNPYPLRAKGLEVIVNALKILNTTHPAPSSVEEHRQAVLSEPLDCVLRVLPALLAVLLQDPQPSGVAGVAPLGPVRLCIMDLVSTLFEVECEQVDNFLCSLGALPVMISVNERFPEHDLAFSLTDKIFSSLTERVITSQFREYVMGSGILQRLTLWIQADANRLSSLHFRGCLYADLIVRANLCPEDLRARFDEAVATATLSGLRITGKDFSTPNCGCNVPVIHRDLCNPRRISLDIHGSSEGGAVLDWGERNPSEKKSQAAAAGGGGASSPAAQAAQGCISGVQPHTAEELLACYRYITNEEAPTAQGVGASQDADIDAFADMFSMDGAMLVDGALPAGYDQQHQQQEQRVNSRERPRPMDAADEAWETREIVVSPQQETTQQQPAAADPNANPQRGRINSPGDSWARRAQGMRCVGVNSDDDEDVVMTGDTPPCTPPESQGRSGTLMASRERTPLAANRRRPRGRPLSQGEVLASGGSMGEDPIPELDRNNDEPGARYSDSEDDDESGDSPASDEQYGYAVGRQRSPEQRATSQ